MALTATDISVAGLCQWLTRGYTEKNMGRWTPDARSRIEEAALELFNERGFESVTVSEIAARAGLTERTYFRHFADKREVLFGGQSELLEFVAEAIIAAPAEVAPLDAVVWTFARIADEIIEERRALVEKRNAVITTVEGLKERELLKLAALSQIIAQALQSRGASALTASLAAEAGVTVFKVAFERWIEPANERSLVQLIGETLDQLRAVTGKS